MRKLIGNAAIVLVVTAILAASGLISNAVAGEKLYRHVVLFKFAESASREKVAEIEKAFGELPGKIDSIVAYEWGTNVSPEGLDKGFTHCFLVSFKNKAGIEAYLPHPAHQEFVALLKPHLEDVLVIDIDPASTGSQD